MRIRPLASEARLSRRLFEQLAGEIRSGRLAAGARLPTEQALTRAAKVSRTVVRESAGLAAERAGKVDVRAISAAVDAMDRAVRENRSAVDEDLAFHRAIAEATGNAEFPRFLQFIGRHLIPRRTVAGLPERMGGQRAYLGIIQEEHRRIADAIAARDPKASREAMRRHLTRSLDRYRKLASDQKKAA